MRVRSLMRFLSISPKAAKIVMSILPTAALEAIAMAGSLVLDEFTANNIWMVQASVVLAFVVAIALIPTARPEMYQAAE